jgi:hypothetical protein
MASSYIPTETETGVKVQDMADWAGAAVALVGAVFVWTQVMIQRGQHRLQEAETHQQQAEAWSKLAADWETAQLVAAGRAAVGRFGAAEADLREYFAVVEEVRTARVYFLDFIERDHISAEDWEKYDVGIAESASRLNPYRRSVQRVVIHLAQVSGLVLRGRLSMQVAYDAFGLQAVRLRHYLPNLVREGYALRTSCPGPTNMELALWRTLPIEEVATRLGWGDFLEVARATAERISVFIDLLTAHAVQWGDAGSEVGPDEEHAPGSEIASLDRLAVAWSVGRRIGIRKAVQLVVILDRAGRKARRANIWSYPRWLLRILEKLHIYPKWMPPRNGFLRAPVDLITRPWRVVRAAWRSRRVEDVRSLISPYEYRKNLEG